MTGAFGQISCMVAPGRMPVPATVTVTVPLLPAVAGSTPCIASGWTSAVGSFMTKTSNDWLRDPVVVAICG